ncbi:MAG: class I SAM-dependent methyltransferase [Candidatus Humimicrobiaceae bacterium]
MISKVLDYRYELSKVEFSLVKCRNCGLVYLNPRPDNVEIKKYYPQLKYYNIYKKSFSILLSNYSLIRFINNIKKYKKKGRLLDIGYGGGGLLYEMQKQGFEVFGLDTSSEAFEIVNKKMGFNKNIFNCELEDCKFPNNYFDVITLCHVLEHLPDPKKTLYEIEKKIKDDGILIVSVPNIDCFVFKVFKRFWFSLDAPRHYYHFSYDTIDKILKSTGFKVIKVNYPPMNFPLDPLKSLILFLKEKKITNIFIYIILFIFHPFLIVFSLFFLLLHFFKTAQDFEVYCRKC